MYSISKSSIQAEPKITMKPFESKLAEATAPPNAQILGVITTVVNAKGTVLYHQRSGSQSLFPSSPPIDANSAFFLGSAGKFITHIAALQLVERGLLTFDEPVSKYLFEPSRHRKRKSLSVTS
ncbi:uncharacterized protein K444DRAFT_129603 [Hyaloscypha bicolor E]|uniref:Beta-lactamase-related domain-containing protein n=1 Tax=Hyaloscypha bicolor E TaxID=1095630 RepID=A0A2J6SUK2_9HELO|nr:uncharacterized protein K444DRAFT_129603 [Hyaloscypha bicolor E]PMD54455.1 hypothetical protein K444DRAFT_129603 [Hyaloscypha bicolor E]